ncbi:MAG: hypothetical protein ACXWMH_00705 [Syntrophales bacterium]
MSSPLCRKKSFSSTATGGDHGVDAGTDLFVMMQAGASMEEFRVGTAGYTLAGERTIDSIFGEAIHGTIIIYIMLTFIETGGPGIIPAIGTNRKIDNLHITMMERSTLQVIRIGTKVLDKQMSTKPPQGPDKVGRRTKLQHKQMLTKLLPDKVTRLRHKGLLTKAPQTQTLTKAPPLPDRVTGLRHKELLTKAPQLLGKDTLEQEDTVLPVTFIARAKPLHKARVKPRKVNIINEESKTNCLTNGRSTRIAADVELALRIFKLERS